MVGLRVRVRRIIDITLIISKFKSPRQLILSKAQIEGVVQRRKLIVKLVVLEILRTKDPQVILSKQINLRQTLKSLILTNGVK